MKIKVICKYGQKQNGMFRFFFQPRRCQRLLHRPAINACPTRAETARKCRSEKIQNKVALFETTEAANLRMSSLYRERVLSSSIGKNRLLSFFFFFFFFLSWTNVRVVLSEVWHSTGVAISAHAQPFQFHEKTHSKHLHVHYTYLQSKKI